MAGRKPIPTNLKMLRGNPGRRPLPKNEPKIPAGIPKVPPHLNREAKKEWKRIVPELEQAGLLTKVDGSALAAYCDCFSTWAQASRKIKKGGLTVTGDNGIPVVSPYLKISNAALDRMRQFLVEFGMTPSSRSKVKAAEKPEVPEGEDYFGWSEANRN